VAVERGERPCGRAYRFIRAGKTVGICGQGPSDQPDLASWLVKQGIQSASLNPDAVLSTWLALSGDQAV
jgi:pyruvate,water dikinase